jgi:hypothetical protein
MIRCFTPALLVAVAVCLTTLPASAQGNQGELLPRARLLHNFTGGIYRAPFLLETKEGSRLLVWVDHFDPQPKSRFPGMPLPAPVFDVIIWDVPTNKAVQKMSYPKEPTPYSYVEAPPPNVLTGGPFGMMAFTPDGKRLAFPVTQYKQVPGKIVHESFTQIRLFDLATHAGQLASPAVYQSYPFPKLLFAPDGALIILADTRCTIQELGKAKPRQVFKVVRADGYQKIPGFYDFLAAAVSPDGSQLAVGADGFINVYDLATGKMVLQAERATPDAKSTWGTRMGSVSLSFGPDAKEPQLFTVEIVQGAPKSFVLARLFNLKENKEVRRKVLVEQPVQAAAPFQHSKTPLWGAAFGYYTPKGEPRVLFEGKLFDAGSGQVLHQFDRGAGMHVSRDGKHLVRLLRKGEKTFDIELWNLDNSQ